MGPAQCLNQARTNPIPFTVLHLIIERTFSILMSRDFFSYSESE